MSCHGPNLITDVVISCPESSLPTHQPQYFQFTYNFSQTKTVRKEGKHKFKALLLVSCWMAMNYYNPHLTKHKKNKILS